jgi:hypothetical protein
VRARRSFCQDTHRIHGTQLYLSARLLCTVTLFDGRAMRIGYRISTGVICNARTIPSLEAPAITTVILWCEFLMRFSRAGVHTFIVSGNWKKRTRETRQIKQRFYGVLEAGKGCDQ